MSKDKKIEIEIEDAPQMPETGEAVPMSPKSPNIAPSTIVQATPQKKRIYSGDIRIESDMFKLEVAVMNKNYAPDGHKPELVKLEHCHIFRTYDSDGKRHVYSSPVGGHFHKIDYDDSIEGIVKIKAISPPLHMVKRNIHGELQTVIEALPKYLSDNHVHKINYVRSDSVLARQTNPNAVQMISAEAVKGAKIPGVIG